MVDPADDLHGAAPGRADAVLLILDMFSGFEFEDGAQLCRAALPVARRVRALKREATRHGVPTIYVNDHGGRWRADFCALLRHCASRGRSLSAPFHASAALAWTAAPLQAQSYCLACVTDGEVTVPKRRSRPCRA